MEKVPSLEQVETARQLNAIFVETLDNNFEMVDAEVFGDLMSEAEFNGQSTLFNTPQEVARWCTLIPLFAALFLRGSIAFFIRSGHPAQWKKTAEENRKAIADAIEQMGGFENLEKMSLDELAARAEQELAHVEEHLMTSPGEEEKKVIVVRKGEDEVFRKISEFFISEKGVVRL